MYNPRNCFRLAKQKLQKVKNPKLFRTLYADPQIAMFELDDDQWHKILQRPPYLPRKKNKAIRLAAAVLADLVDFSSGFPLVKQLFFTAERPGANCHCSPSHI